jgi:uncharacterized protein Yka (UPF0111/DUF47 family)
MEASTTKKSPLIAPDSGAGHHHVVDNAEDTAHLLEFKETSDEVSCGTSQLYLSVKLHGHHHVVNDAEDTAHLLELRRPRTR